MYSGGKQPFGPLPFPKIDTLLTEHCHKAGDVLDIGAGYGRDAIYLAKEHKCRVTAVDPAPEGIKARLLHRPTSWHQCAIEDTRRQACMTWF